MKDWHYEQSRWNSCVAACMCIVQKWRGETPTEALHHEGASEDGHPVERALLLKGAVAAALSDKEEGDLIFHIENGGIVLILVEGWSYVAWQLRKYPQLVSRHGEMWTPGKYLRKRPYHTVVLVRWEETAGFGFLDPWFPSDEQPLLIGQSDFSKCFAGNAVFMNPMPR